MNPTDLPPQPEAPPASAPANPAMAHLGPEALTHVAAWFQTLSEPTRLQILNLLRTQSRSVGELAKLCDCSAANVSRHLDRLTQNGFVSREARGTSVFYTIADESIYALCDLVCMNVARQLERQARRHEAFAPVQPDPSRG